MKEIRKLWIGIAILALLSPVGLLPSGDAWGEWGAEEFKKMIGFIPVGLKRFSGLWNAPMPDYTVPGTGDSVGYIISALVGILLVAVVTWSLGRFLLKRD